MSEENLGKDVKELSIQDDESKQLKEDSIPIENDDTVEDIDTNHQNTDPVIEELEVQDSNEEDDVDDFGAFSDASFDEFEQSRPEPSTEELPTTKTTTYTQLPQSQFESPTNLHDTLDKLLSIAFPDKLLSSPVPQNTDVLNERSRLLLERLTALPYLKPHNWKKSSLRRQLLVTLGIPDDFSTKSRRRNLDDGMHYKIRSFEELGFKEDDATKFKETHDDIVNKLESDVKDDDELNAMEPDQLVNVVADYETKIEEISKLLAVWEYEQKKLEADNHTFEGVVENLVGHTQRLRREETLQSLKKEAHRSKRLSSMFKLKSKK